MTYELTQEQKDILETLNNPNEKVIKINAFAGCGKAQPMYSKVLTDNGWVKMGNIKIGDKVANSQGGFSEIIGIFPRGKMDIYRVHFDNGDYTDCTADHLWTTQTDRERVNNKHPQVRTTQQIIDTLYFSNKTGSRVVKNHSVPYIKPVNFPKRKLKLNPYVLGVLIGDGSLSKDNGITITNPDKDIIDRVIKELPDTDRITEHNPKNRCVYYSIQNKIKWTRSTTIDLIKKLEATPIEDLLE